MTRVSIAGLHAPLAVRSSCRAGAACVRLRRLRLCRKMRPKVTPAGRAAPGRQFVAAEVIAEVKDFAVTLGGDATENFCGQSDRRNSDNRCYFTGKLQLPAFYSALRMVREDGERCAARGAETRRLFLPSAGRCKRRGDGHRLARRGADRAAAGRRAPRRFPQSARGAESADGGRGSGGNAGRVSDGQRICQGAIRRGVADRPQARSRRRLVPAEVVHRESSITRRSVACTRFPGRGAHIRHRRSNERPSCLPSCSDPARRLRRNRSRSTSARPP